MTSSIGNVASVAARAGGSVVRQVRSVIDPSAARPAGAGQPASGWLAVTVFGETPYRYLQRRRVERAMFMLRYGAESVTDICMSVGFTSLGTFSRTFSSIVGQSPSEYRADKPEAGVAPTYFIMRWTRPTRPRR